MSTIVKYIEVAEGMIENASITTITSNLQPFAERAQLDKLIGGGADIWPFATLESGGFPLDGERIFFDEAYHTKSNAGWWSSALSDNSGDLPADQIPTFDIRFDEQYTTSGLKFAFAPESGQWCSKLRITWWGDNVQIESVLCEPDAGVYAWNHPMVAFDHIRIELLRTNIPHNFAKIGYIQIGLVHTFADSDITIARLFEEVDHTLCSVPIDTTYISIRDRNNRDFAPIKNQRVELYHNGELRATHYITDVSRTGKAGYTISGQSILGVLDGETYWGGMYDNMFVSELLAAILPNHKYALHSAFHGVRLTGYLPTCTRRKALQQIAFAIGAMITTYGTSTIYIVPLPQTVSGAFTDSEILLGTEKLESKQKYSKVAVTAHEYAPLDDRVTLIKEAAVNGDHLLYTFSEPYCDFELIGGDIVSRGWDWIEITAYDTITLTARPYYHSKLVLQRRNYDADIATRGSELSVPDCTLINPGNAAAALDRLYAAAQLREQLTHTAIVDAQTAGDVATTITHGDKQIIGHIAALSHQFTANGHVAIVKIMGKQQEVAPVWAYSGELRSGDEEMIY